MHCLRPGTDRRLVVAHRGEKCGLARESASTVSLAAQSGWYAVVGQMRKIEQMASPMHAFPEIFRVRQTLEGPRVDDVPAAVHAALAGANLAPRLRPGQTVAITAGSRGIANIAAILRAAVEHLRGLGAQPFLVPPMGSHGGGTAAGQQGVLESYGIAEATVGCPIRASMETVVVCRARKVFQRTPTGSPPATVFPSIATGSPSPPTTRSSAAASSRTPRWPAATKADC